MTDRDAKADGRFEIRTGSLVVATDGEVGRVDGVVVSPDTGAVDGLVVRAALQFGHDLLVPVEAVEDAVEDLVRLRLTVEDLAALSPLAAEALTEPAAGWRPPDSLGTAHVMVRRPGPPVQNGLRPGEAGRLEHPRDNVELRTGQWACNADGEVGPVEVVLLDARTDQVSHLVVRRGGLVGQDTVVPAAWVRDVQGDRIVLDATREQLAQLPEYRPDDAITDAVQGILWYRSNLPETEVRHVKARTVDGVVELGGYASTERGRMAIETLVRGVSGVLDVRNGIRTFEALSGAARPLR